MEVTVLDGKASFSIFQNEEMPAEMIEQLGLNGTVIEVMEDRVEFSSATVSNGILTLFDVAPKAYRSTTYEGTAAAEYVAVAKAQYKEMYEAGRIKKSEYDEAMALLNGEEVDLGDEAFGYNVTINIKVNDADMTCLTIVVSSDDEDRKYILEREYTADGKVTKETNYSMSVRGGSVEIFTYYPDGKTVKTFEEYHLIVDGETGEYEFGDLSGKYEYREDGTTKLSERYYDTGSYEVREYDENDKIVKITTYRTDGSYMVREYENGEQISKTLYDKDGNIIE